MWYNIVGDLLEPGHTNPVKSLWVAVSDENQHIPVSFTLLPSDPGGKMDFPRPSLPIVEF
jgi:hypothetical protein